jgi:hypothetical protein
MAAARARSAGSRNYRNCRANAGGMIPKSLPGFSDQIMPEPAFLRGFQVARHDWMVAGKRKVEK